MIGYQLKVIRFLSLPFYEMDHYIEKFSLNLKQEMLQNILFNKNTSSLLTIMIYFTSILKFCSFKKF